MFHSQVQIIFHLSVFLFTSTLIHFCYFHPSLLVFLSIDSLKPRSQVYGIRLLSSWFVIPSSSLISSSPRGSWACRAEVAAGLGTVLEALGVGNHREAGLTREGARGRAASLAAEEVGSCCNLEADRPGLSWEEGMWRVGAPEVEQRAGGRRGRAASVERSPGAWAGRRGRRSSSGTAGSGSPRRTCTSWWWT